MFLFLSFAYGQELPFDLKEKEALIKKLLSSQPDSARVHIKDILRYNGKVHDTVQANACLFYGYTCLIKNEPDSSLFYYNRALTYAQGYDSNTARVLRNKGAALRKKSEYQKSLEVLSLAEAKYKNLKDDRGLATVYGEMASNYNQMLKSDEAIRHLLMAIALLEKNHDNFYIYPIKQSLANTYMNAGNYQFAIDLYKEVQPYFKATSSKNYYVTLINYGDCLMYTDRLAEAEKVMLEALGGLNKFGDNSLSAVCYSKLGVIARKGLRYKTAEQYQKKAYALALADQSPQLAAITAEYLLTLNHNKKHSEAAGIIASVERAPVLQKANASDKLSLEHQKAYTFLKLNDAEKVAASLKNKVELMDTLRKNDDPLATLSLQQQYQSNYQAKKNKALQQINASLQDKVNESKKANLIPLGFLATILLSLAAAYGYRNRKYRQTIASARDSKHAIALEYEQRKKLNALRQREIESKQKELVYNIQALYTTESHINGLLDSAKNNPGGIDTGTVRAELLTLTSEDNYWALFKKRFNESHAGFQQNLAERFPQLTKNDLYFCALLRLKLPYKDLAVFMQVAPESVVKKKYRVKKRMELDGDTELEQLLQDTPTSSVSTSRLPVADF